MTLFRKARPKARPDALQDIRARNRGARSMGGPRQPVRAARTWRLSLAHVLWLALLAFGIALAVAARVATHWVITRPVFDIHQVVVTGNLEQVDQDLVRKRALALHGSFFTLDLGLVTAELRTVAWVRAVSVRRVWPDTLAIDVEEQHPVARWGEGELVNTRGERFTAEYTEVLPYFRGPQGSETQMLEEFQAFRAQLAALPLAITDLELTDRGAWRLTADNGLEIELGRDEVHDRLARFIQVYPQLVRITAPSGAVADLRYTHGFALRMAAGTKDSNS